MNVIVLSIHIDMMRKQSKEGHNSKPDSRDQELNAFKRVGASGAGAHRLQTEVCEVDQITLNKLCRR